MPWQPLNLKRTPGNGLIKDVFSDSSNLAKVTWRANWIALGVFAGASVLCATALAGVVIGAAAAGGSSSLLLQGGLVWTALAVTATASAGYKAAVIAAAITTLAACFLGPAAMFAALSFETISMTMGFAAANPEGRVSRSLDFVRVKILRLPSGLPQTV